MKFNNFLVRNRFVVAIASSFGLSFFVFYIIAYGSTTIGTSSITTDGTLTVSGVTSLAAATSTSLYASGTLTVGGNATTTSAGALSLQSILTVVGNSVLASSDVGGGYGSTGATISAAGNISANGNLIVDGTTSLAAATSTSLYASGALTVGGKATTTSAGNLSIEGDLVIGGTCTGCGGGGTFAWTPGAEGNSTSTRLIFGNGFISQASSTVFGGLSIDRSTSTNATSTTFRTETLTVGGNATTTSAGALSVASTITSGGAVLISANDGGALGVSGTAFSDLFLASGGIINFNASDITLTHAANLLTFAGGDMTLTAGASGDLILTMETDTGNDPDAEDANPWIYMTQDAGATEGFIGLGTTFTLGTAFNRTITGVLANAILLNSEVSDGLGRVQLATQDIVRLTVDHLGNVGIGTSTSQAKLSVIGKVLAEHFEATSTTATSLFSGSVQLNGATTFGSGGTAMNNLIFGVCTTAAQTITASTTAYVNCINATGVDTTYNVLVQASSTLPNDLVIQAASSSETDIINLRVYNSGATAASSDIGGIGIFFWAVK